MPDNPIYIPDTVTGGGQYIDETTPDTILDQYKAANPDLPDVTDTVLARQVYDSGMHKKDASFPAFATRIGVTQGTLETALNSGLTTAAFHVNEPVESALSGIGT